MKLRHPPFRFTNQFTDQKEFIALDEGGIIYLRFFSTVLGAFGEVVALDLFFS